MTEPDIPRYYMSAAERRRVAEWLREEARKSSVADALHLLSVARYLDEWKEDEK